MNLIQGQLDFANRDRKDANSKWRPKPIFDGEPINGKELKEQGTKKVLAKKPSQIYASHLQAALKLFPVRSRITVEQLTGIAGRPPEGVHVNAVGAIIAGMAKRGLIRKTGKTVQAGRRERHSGEVAEWEIVSFS